MTAYTNPKEVFQRFLRQNLFADELLPEPATVEEQFISNLWIPTVSQLAGYTENGSVLLRATIAGDLKVATVGSGYDIYEVVRNVGGTTYIAGAKIETIALSSRWDILVTDYEATFKFRTGNTVGFNPEIRLPVGGYSIDFVCIGAAWKNTVGAEVTTVQIVGYR